MRWFVFGAEGVRLPWKEWGRAVADPEDLMVSAALGGRAYRACVRLAGLPPEKGTETTLAAFAHVLHHTLDEMDEARWLELRYYLQESWAREEPGLWEPPDLSIWPIEEDLTKELLTVRHVMERVVFPELLRLWWCMMTSSGSKAPLRSWTRCDRAPSPLSMFDMARAEDVPPFLDEEDRDGLAFFREGLVISDRISADELMAELASQRYLVHNGKIFVDGAMSGGGWHGKKDLRRWCERAMRTGALLFAFRVMFLASVVGESGPLRVFFPGDSPD